MKNLPRTVVLGCGLVVLAGCGADEIVSPGTSGDIIINNPAPPSPTPPPTGAGNVTPAAGCPTINSTGGLTDRGTIQGPTGEYRICEMPAVFDAENDTLPYVPGLLYSMNGRVDVGADVGAANSFGATDPLAGEDPVATLEIEPGVIIYASSGRSFLVVNRGSRIEADGTATDPIIWTSRDNILGLTDDDSDQQWGGVVLLGRAPTSDCATGAFNTAANPTANPQCEQLLEGTTISTIFGGDFDDDSSGSMTFNQIRFSGFALAPGDELQALTTGSIGNGTTLDNIQSFNSSDDGIEFFGGTVNMRNVAVVGASDDSIDADTGTQGALQYVVVAQRSNAGDSIIELDSPPDDFSTAAIPQTVLAVTNFTFIQGSGNDQVVRARGGSRIRLSNGIIEANGTPCVRIDQPETIAAAPTFDSIVGDCSASTPLRATDGAALADLEAIYNAASANNTLDTDVTFTNGFFFDASATPVFDATATSTFFEATTFVGALSTADDTRFQGWTCDSGTLNFGSGSSCTSLPIRPGEED
ncbi:MAG: hypothetical protein QNI87_08690 [Erythrobacter sp.]|uniref:hypothetical protein n=1 Tax=Erythrobacter sp. TaxID=1042 RepID=UPI00262F279A|nr:hypothetical protein [Erythrobacter sp.]MDJ0978601.1 hypothetical protein [Erythrobacter sp.]